MPSSLRLAVASAVAAFASSLAGADVVAGWSITTALPVGPPPSGASYVYGLADLGTNTVGSSLSGVHAAAATVWTSPSGNGSQFSLSSNTWAIGDYYEVRLSTLGFTDINISWDQARSSTGPSSFSLIMSVDGGANFTTLLASYAVLQSGGGGAPGTWGASTPRQAIYTVSSAAAGAANQADVIFRMVSLVAAGGTSGSSRIDNISVEGVVIPAPGAVALLGLAGLAARRRRA